MLLTDKQFCRDEQKESIIAAFVGKPFVKEAASS